MKLNMIEAQSMAKDHFDEHLTRDVEHEKNMVEAAGIEPASDSVSAGVSTCVVFLLGFALPERVRLAFQCR